MGKCGCGFTTDAEGACNGTHKVVKKVRESITNQLEQEKNALLAKFAFNTNSKEVQFAIMGLDKAIEISKGSK
jgi:hypothetical protein